MFPNDDVFDTNYDEENFFGQARTYPKYGDFVSDWSEVGPLGEEVSPTFYDGDDFYPDDDAFDEYDSEYLAFHRPARAYGLGD